MEVPDETLDEENFEELINLCDQLIFENEQLKVNNQNLQDEVKRLEEIIANALYLLDKVAYSLNRI